MSEFYAWANELRAGGDPWLPRSAPGFRSIPGVAHLGHCNYPPAFLLAFEPLTRLRLSVAYWIWQGIIVTTLMLATVLMVRELGPPTPAWPSYLLALGAVLLFPEVYGALYESQPTFVLLMLLVATWVCDRRGLSTPAGLLIAAAAMLKIYPAFAAGYFVIRRRWATVGWATLFGVAGLAMLTARYQSDYAHYGILTSAWLTNDAWLRNDRSIAVLSNLRVILDWLYGGPVPAHALALWYALTAFVDLSLIVSAAAVTQYARDRRDLDLPCLGLWLCAAVIVSPIAWGHYLPFALPLLLGLGACALRGARPHLAGGVLLVSGLVGIVLPFFSGAMRNLHMLFWATLMIYTDGCVLISHWAGVKPAEILKPLPRESAI